MTRPTITAFALVLAAAAAACTIYPAEPASPTYAKDVQPIFMAHCVRCHGGGGMLTNETIDGAWSPDARRLLPRSPGDDRGDCTARSTAVCPLLLCASMARSTARRAVDGSRTTLIEFYLFDAAKSRAPCRRCPAAPLNEWEMNIVGRWIGNGAPP